MFNQEAQWTACMRRFCGFHRCRIAHGRGLPGQSHHRYLPSTSQTGKTGARRSRKIYPGQKTRPEAILLCCRNWHKPGLLPLPGEMNWHFPMAYPFARVPQAIPRRVTGRKVPGLSTWHGWRRMWDGFAPAAIKTRLIAAPCHPGEHTWPTDRTVVR